MSTEKTPPPIYPELFDFVPLVQDKNLNLLNVDAMSDTVEAATENYPASDVAKIMNYNGTRTYDGGDLNRHNGTIRANGTYTFDSGGSRAKIEILALDLDGAVSIQQNKKSAPVNYLELFDYVQKTEDEAGLDMQFSFEYNLNAVDGGGSMNEELGISS